MPISKRFTVQRFMEESIADLGIDKNNKAYVERFELISNVTSIIGLSFYDLWSQYYLTSVTINPDTTGKYSTANTGTWTVATSTLVFNDMNVDFGSGDIGKIIIFRIGALVYIGQISGFVDGNTVTVTGHNLPTSNGTVNYVMVVSTTPTADDIYIGDLPINRSISAVKIELESTATQDVNFMSANDLSKWITDADKNVGKIVWTLAGDYILLKKHDDLSTYGTFTLRYPRIPLPVTADSDYLDLPDGTAIELAFLKFKKLIMQRIGLQPPDYMNEMLSIVKSMYNVQGSEISLEEAKEKVKALA